MTKKEQERESRIPEFGSREQEAEWIDTHEMADYQDEFKVVKAGFGWNVSDALNLRLDKETLATLRAQAREQGLGPTTLARMWILEHRRDLKRAAALPYRVNHRGDR